MLSRVLDLVAAEGWFDIQAPFETTINLTQGACLWLLLTRQGVSDTYVKFSDHVDLRREALRCAAASHSYPGLVPRFVGHLQREGLHVLVCRAVDHRGIDPRALQRRGLGHPLLRDLLVYFAAMRGTLLPAELTPLRNADLVQELLLYFNARHELHALARRWLAGSAALLRQLPDVPQHGDLVPNNIGQDVRGNALIFDWEDLGASCLPGLDLFTFEMSLAADAGALLAGRAQPASKLQAFVREACRLMPLEFADYQALTPLHALVFRYLKRNYGPGVRQRMDRLLLELDAQWPVRPAVLP